MGFFRSHHLDDKLSQAIYDIFRVRMPVALTVCGQREAWVEKMRAERGFSFAAEPASAPDDEPPPWGRCRAGRPGCRPVRRSAGRKRRARRSGPPRGSRRSPRRGAQKARRAQGRPRAQGPRHRRPARAIGELAEDSGIVVIEGTVTGVNDPKELKGGETVLATFAVYDDTSTIYCKAFYNYPHAPRRARRNARAAHQGGARAGHGTNRADQKRHARAPSGRLPDGPVSGGMSVGVRDLQQMPKIERMDTAAEKRIELHMHTNMSTMDATRRCGRADRAGSQMGASRRGHHRPRQRPGLPPRPLARPRSRASSSSPVWRAICATWFHRDRRGRPPHRRPHRGAGL